MSRGYSVEQWVQWISEQRASGLSIAAFCESIGVSQNAFYVRRRQLTRRGHSSGSQPQHSSSPCSQPSAGSFVSLKLAATESAVEGRAVVEIDLPGRVVVRVNDRQVVGDIVSVILEHGGQR